MNLLRGIIARPRFNANKQLVSLKKKKTFEIVGKTGADESHYERTVVDGQLVS